MPLGWKEEFVRFYIRDGVLHVVCEPLDIMDLDKARRLTSARLEFQQGQAYPVFCDTRFMKHADKAAREHFANEGVFLVKAVGLLVDHHSTEALLNFFLRINKPIVPFKLYKSEEEALGFLKLYTTN